MPGSTAGGAPATHDLRITPGGFFRSDGLLSTAGLGRLLDVLNPPGEETRLVGGAVRNALLGLRPGDVDLATTMEPQDVMRRAKAAKLRALPTGVAHGTVTVLSGGQPFEVTTLREDVETDGRHAVVRFGRDFARDAQRRDFTINALSLGADGRVFDAVGGLADLRVGRVRFIGEADTRVREDYLRILRFFRFHATYGIGAFDEEGLAAAARQREGLARLSRERVRAETLKILTAPGCLDALKAMAGAGLLPFLLPWPADLDRLARLLAAAGTEADALLRLAALGPSDMEHISHLRDNLRLTNAETKRLDAAGRAMRHMEGWSRPPDELDVRRLLFAHGREATIDALRLVRATGENLGDLWPQRIAFAQVAAIPAAPFGSADLMRRGCAGPALGLGLAAAKGLWAETGFPDDRATLDDLLDRAAGARRP